MVSSILPDSVSRKLSVVFLLTSLVSINALTSQAAKASTNLSPTISAGPDRSTKEQTSVDLIAESQDQDGQIIGHRWQQTKGPKVRLNDAKTATANFIAPDMYAGQSPILLVFKASAKDDDRATASDYVKITVYPSESVPNVLPTVDAGSDQTTSSQAYVALKASASDLDGNISSYQWSQSSGTPVGLVDADQADANFTSPSGEATAAFTFTVTVTDDQGAQASDSVIINVAATNQEPSVSTDNDQTVYEQTLVNLNASASDADGQINSYQWQQTSGNPVSLIAHLTANASFTAPDLADSAPTQAFTFDITVTDDLGATATDSITVNVLPTVEDNTSMDCTVTINPGDSFTSAFDQLSAGQTLCLNDGLYVQAMNIPSNINVRAVNDGMAELDGGDTLGLEWRGGLLTMSGSNSSVRGLKVYHSSTNSDACTIDGSNNTMRLMSCSHGGTHKHKIPLKVSGSGHLIEDSWFYGEGRYVLQCYSGDSITIRRNVIRWDKTLAEEPDEPNASMSNYSCSDMIWENNISLDYGIPDTYMKHCGDICMSTIANDPNLRVQYLGNMVVNHDPTTGNNKAFRADQKGTVPSTDITIADFYVRSVSRGIAVNPLYQNITIDNCTMLQVDDQGGTDSNPANCNNDADVSVRYINGVKTSEALFPFAHQALIKRDMCANGERQSAWCSSNKSLGDYVLNR
jgi:hypothetical protein